LPLAQRLAATGGEFASVDALAAAIRAAFQAERADKERVLLHLNKEDGLGSTALADEVAVLPADVDTLFAVTLTTLITFITLMTLMTLITL
jgi:hypothetical protein